MIRQTPLILLLALAGCALGPADSPHPDDLAPLGPGLFAPGNAASEQAARELAIEHLRQDADMLAGIDGLTPRRVTVDRFGGAHARVEQTVDGVPVFGGEAIVHLAADGTFTGYTDALVRNPKVDTTPQLSSDQATDLAALAVGGWHTVTGTPSADLVILPDPRGAHLTWRVQIAQFEPGALPAAPVVFVDAHSGEVVWRTDNLKSDFPHDVLTDTWGNEVVWYTTWDAHELTTTNFGDYDEPDTDDLVARTAHQNAGLSLAWFWAVQGRKSFDGDLDGDGQGAPVNLAVHYDSQLANAYWYRDALYLGDGNGSTILPLVSLDIVAHELSHGVTEYSAGLIYQDESGALNEATSDIFAAVVEAAQSGATFQDIWWVGEDVWHPEDPEVALRYMNNPALAGDPDYYPERFIGYPDYGYVHYNSGIANLWFYLLSEGGSHPTFKTSNEVPGIGIQNAADIWYDTLVHRLTPATTFWRARVETLATAEAYAAACTEPDCPDFVGGVAGAWDAVGVVPKLATVLEDVELPDMAAGDAYRISVDSVDNDGMIFELSGPVPDGDLYVRFDREPTLKKFDCRPYSDTTNETCTFEPAQDGTYYVMVDASSAFSDGTLKISSFRYAPTCDGTDTDGDGVCDDVDPCPLDFPDDSDGDGVCDSDDPCPMDFPDDWDGDGICDSDDICPHDNPDDTDGDGVCDSIDPCPTIPNDQDSDGDGVPDCFDDCTYVPGDISNYGCPTTEDCDYEGTIGKTSFTYEIGPHSAGTLLSVVFAWTPESNDLDLYLEYLSGTRWRIAAIASTGNGVGTLSYEVPGNLGGYDFRWKVQGRSRSDTTYCLVDNL